MLHALRALNDGHGLLWNSFQNCGQPFFANPQTALLYPPNWIFLALDVDSGLQVLTALHLLVGAVGTYGLCRALGLDRLSAMAGAIAFELGGNTLGLAAWMPNVSGAYAWMPVAAFAFERLLRIGNLSGAIVLCVVLAVQLLAGAPQVAFFTYQILLLRLAWLLATKQCHGRAVGLAVAGMVVAPLLAAVHLVPGLEFAAESVRSGALSAAEADSMLVTWERFRFLLDARVTGPGTSVSIIACALAGAALMQVRRSPGALCFALLTCLFAVLSFENPVSQTYRMLPMAMIFRGMDRFLWPAGFCFSVLVAHGVHAIRVSEHRGETADPPLPRWVMGLMLGGGIYYWLARGKLSEWEWGLAVALACLVATVAVAGRRFQVASTVVVVILVVNLFVSARAPLHGMLKDAPAVFARNQEAFALIRERLEARHRVLAVGPNADYSLMHKSSSIFNMPGVSDYEPMTSRRYAEFYVKMMYGAANELWMVNINQFYYLPNAVPRNLALLNLVATRFLAVDKGIVEASPKPPPFSLLRQVGPVGVYENAAALPRAFFVPAIEVVPDGRDVLRRLSSRTFPVRSLALLTEPPEDAWHGAAASMGSAEIVADRSEELIVRAFSTEGGFVFLSDQYFPGWTATVNDVPTPVLNANYAFRLVRIPPGASEVVFRYAPAAIRTGAWISLVAAMTIGVAALLAVARALPRLRRAPG